MAIQKKEYVTTQNTNTIEEGRLLVEWTPSGEVTSLSWSPYVIDDITKDIKIQETLQQVMAHGISELSDH